MRIILENDCSGENAILALTDFIQIYRKKIKNKRTLINFGVIKGGSASNIVPDFASLDINIRDQKEENITHQLNLIQSIITQLNKKTSVKLKLYKKSIRGPKPFNSQTKALFNEFKKQSSQCGLTFKTKAS